MRFVRTAESIFGLPIGFQRVEFLESTNQQNNDASTKNAAYIDTGVTPDSTTKIECRVQFITLISGNSNEALFGTTGVSSSDPARMAFGFASVSPYTNFYMGLGIQNLTTSVARDTVAHIFTIDASTSSWKIDNVTGTFSNPGEVVGAGPMYLFARNYAAYEYANKPANAKLYYCKVWKNGVLIRDFIPCIDPLGVACMYDLVGKKPYYNQGTGTFTAGRQIIPVEYIETDGTAFINTGYTPSGSTETEITTMLKDQTYSRFMFGCRSAQNSNTYACLAHNYNRIGYRVGATGSYLYSSGYNELNVKHTYKIANGVFYRDDVVINTTCEGATTSPNSPLALLTINSNNVLDTTQSFIGNFYSCTIKDNNVLVRDFIPCKDENNVGFVFDTLSGTVYLNAGTGSFSVGENKYTSKLRLIRDNILPTGYTQLEYIEATNAGTIEYAVSDYRLTDTTDWEITFTASAPSNNWVMGQPIWIGVHYRKDETTGNLPMVGIANSSSSASQCYVDYTDDEKITLALKGTDVYANGVKVGSITRVSAGATQTKYGIFAYKDINQALPNLRIRNAKIYRLKIWDNGVLVQDLIPAMKDGVAGFYERVTKTFIEKESNSTADFTTGKPVLPMVRFIKDILPAGYKAVNYLESTGTQYIDTGIYPAQLTKAQIDMQFTSITKCSVLGSNNGASQDSGWNNLFGSNITGQSTTSFWCQWGLNFGGAFTKDLNRHTHIFERDGNTSWTYTVDTTSFTNTTGISTQPTNNQKVMYLFGCNNNGVLYREALVKIYSCTIWDNGVPVRDLYPALRKSDNKPGMYDRITKQFFTNAAQSGNDFNYE